MVEYRLVQIEDTNILMSPPKRQQPPKVWETSQKLSIESRFGGGTCVTSSREVYPPPLPTLPHLSNASNILHPHSRYLTSPVILHKINKLSTVSGRCILCLHQLGYFGRYRSLGFMVISSVFVVSVLN
jgi:hypothetical protein